MVLCMELARYQSLSIPLPFNAFCISYKNYPPSPPHLGKTPCHPTTALPPKSPSINALSIPGSSRTKTANTSIGGASPNPCARFHRRRREIPTQGPYCDDRSKWRRIFSWRERDFWWTGWDVSVNPGGNIGVRLLRFRSRSKERRREVKRG